MKFHFRRAFPALSGRNVKHKDLRSQFPNLTKPRQVVPYTVKETWTHEFCCIPFTYQSTTPTIEEMDLLRASGLGKKKIAFKNKANHSDVCAELMRSFPQLGSCGGFTLHRARSGGQGRPLSKLQTAWYGVNDLKNSGVGSACIYIKPLQKSFDLAPVSKVCSTLQYVVTLLQHLKQQGQMIFLKSMCCEPDWLVQYNYLFCLLQSKRIKAKFLMAVKIHEAKIGSYKTMKFHSKLLCLY